MFRQTIVSFLHAWAALAEASQVSSTLTVGLCYPFSRSLLPVQQVSFTSVVGLVYPYVRSLLTL